MTGSGWLFAVALTAEEPRVSCGAASVWLLLAEHRVDVPLEEIATRLPVRKDGQSAADLVEAGAAWGLPLVAEQLAEGRALPRVPAIFHRSSTDEAGGHFLLGTPVGFGSQADQWMLVDPPRGPDFVHSPELRKSHGYTGWLVRAAAWHERGAVRWAFAALGVAAAAVLWRWRGLRPTRAAG